MRLLLKFLHEISSYGLAGGFAAQLLVMGSDGRLNPQLIGDFGLWLVMPSLALNVLSGLAAMIVRPTFFTKGWVWVKILLTAPTIYAAVATCPGLAFDGVAPRAGVGVALVASLVVTGFSVWRPKIRIGR